MVENLPNLPRHKASFKKLTNSNRINPKISTPRYGTVKFPKTENKENLEIFQRTIGTKQLMTVDFISETTDAKTKWQNVFQVLEKYYQQPRILYLGKKKNPSKNKGKSRYSQMKEY